jgi:hypothetical protein
MYKQLGLQKYLSSSSANVVLPVPEEPYIVISIGLSIISRILLQIGKFTYLQYLPHLPGLTVQYTHRKRVLIWSIDSAFSKSVKTILDELGIPSYVPRAARISGMCTGNEVIIADKESISFLPSPCLRERIILVEPKKHLYSFVKVLHTLVKCDEILVGIDPGKYIGVAVLTKGLLLYDDVYSDVIDIDKRLFSELYDGLDGDIDKVTVGVGVATINDYVTRSIALYAEKYGFKLIYVDEHNSNREHVVGLKTGSTYERLRVYGKARDHINAAIVIALRATMRLER